jgi:hypothetical protein
MLILALRFMMMVRSFRKEISTKLNDTPPERRAAGCILPPAWPLIVFDALAGLFFFLSAWAHTFSCMDERFNKLFWMLEKVGITAGTLSVLVEKGASMRAFNIRNLSECVLISQFALGSPEVL